MLYTLLLDNQEDKDYFEFLYKKYKNGMFNAANEILTNKSEAENVVHESFMSIINNLDKIKGKTEPEEFSYLVTTVRRKAYGYLRTENRFSWNNFEEEMESECVFLEGLEQIVHQQETYKILADMILNMKYPYRDIIIMQYYDQRSVFEISQELGITEINIRQMSKRARRQLERMLNKKGIYDANN